MTDFAGSSARATFQMTSTFTLERVHRRAVLRIDSVDGTNRLHSSLVVEMTAAVLGLAAKKPCNDLVIAGNDKFFSSGADLNEIAGLNGPAALEFSKMGQALMAAIAEFSAPTFAAISGYCMGGGLDLVLACRYRIASPNASFGHRGTALGLITGWGGTQRLPRLIGKGRALEMLVAAESITAEHALRLGLIDAIVEDPIAEALKRVPR
ncbi:MAG: enoyl-CoA hydratase/isomerase family protein [Candidatus Sulfotelmatobacter sp.]